MQYYVSHPHVSTTNCSHLHGATVPGNTCSKLCNLTLSRILCHVVWVYTFRVFSLQLEIHHDSATLSASLFAHNLYTRERWMKMMIILALRHAGLRFISNYLFFYFYYCEQFGNTQLSKARSLDSTSHLDVLGLIHGSCESLNVSCIHPKVYLLDVGSGTTTVTFLHIYVYILFRYCWFL